MRRFHGRCAATYPNPSPSRSPSPSPSPNSDPTLTLTLTPTLTLAPNPDRNPSQVRGHLSPVRERGGRAAPARGAARGLGFVG